MSKRAAANTTQVAPPQKVENPSPAPVGSVQWPKTESTTEKPTPADPKTTVEEAAPAPKHTKKSFNVNFNTKFSKNSAKKKGVASQKIDDDLDFNKMFLGDQVTDTPITKKPTDLFCDLKADFEPTNGAQSAPQNGGTFNFEENKPSRKMSDEDKAEEMSKFHNHQGVGSDMISSQ